MSHGHNPFLEAVAAAQQVDELPKRQMYVTESEMMANKVPLSARDYCAHLVIPLNRCRTANNYLPWTCQNQKHEYEKCFYEDMEWRKRKQFLLDKAKLRPALEKEAADKAAVAAAADEE